MGAGIAEVSARAGADVVVVEASDELATRARARVDKSLEKGVSAGKVSDEEARSARSRIRYVTRYEELADRHLVVEAIVESVPSKLELFRTLDAIVEDRSAVLASNTSSIPIIDLAGATSRPEWVLGMHFFNPVPVMNLVELVRSIVTGDEAFAAASAFAGGVLGKKAIVAKDRAGFIVNALLVPYLLGGVRMYEEGFASAEDIDTGMVEGCRHPMGPLALADFVGIDTVLSIAEILHTEFGDPSYAPPPLLRRMVAAGHLGRKSGRGFYTY
jgi:3-hydroxybutyryl-CoA dehydrogenase